jgi:uncharacterized protein (DUF1501 family)
MRRREFLKLSAITAVALITPVDLSAVANSAIDSLQFDRGSYDTNSPQVLAIFLAGGSSQLAGNLTNFDDIKRYSESNYPNIEITENGFWSDAGGVEMEAMLEAGQLSVVRTIFRVKDNNRSHGEQTAQNQTGSLDGEKSGFFNDILYTLNSNGVISESTVIPAVSFTGGTPTIFQRGDLQIDSHLNFTSLSPTLDNPYSMKVNNHLEDGEDGVLQELANSVNSSSENPLFQKAHGNFLKKLDLADYVDAIVEKEVGIEFPDNSYGETIRSSLKVMVNNPDTKLSYIEFGGWDDHSGAINNYKNRMSSLFEALKSGADYLKSEGNRKISIWVFTEFGRNVNLNKSLGWDHGNNLNLFVIGNSTKYLKLGKIVGETEVFKPSETGNRVYMRPKEGSESYEPFSIASTIHKVFGIQNPEIVTGESAINSILV